MLKRRSHLFAKKSMKYNSELMTKPFIVNGDNREVAIHRLVHADRNQSVTVIPVPRFARNSYFDDWCHQPYIRKHTLAFCFDSCHPLYVGPFRYIGKRYEGLSTFQLAKMPGPVELDLTRNEYTQRCHVMKESFMRLFFTTANYRAKTCKKVVKSGLDRLFNPKTMQKSIAFENKNDGEVYNADSYVLLLEAHWVPHAVEILKSTLGFQIEGQTVVALGLEKDIQSLEAICDTWNIAYLAYFAFLVVCLVVGSCNYFVEVGRKEWVREQERRFENSDFKVL